MRFLRIHVNKNPTLLPCCSIKNPAEVRLVLLLIQILNYMWIKAMFLNRHKVHQDCFLNAICFEASWLTLKFTAIIFSKILSAPAMFVMYVLAVPPLWTTIL